MIYSNLEVIIVSKLANLYKILKNKDSSILYLLKSGIFYIALDEDALTLSDLFNFKLTDLNKNTIKCGFPASRISYYSNLLSLKNINFQIIESIDEDNFYLSQYSNNSSSINNSSFANLPIVEEILNINFDEITFKDAFFILQNLQNDLKNLI